MYKDFWKRVIDFILSLLTLAILWPILLVITIWLHFANKGAGAFFLQERPGKNGKIFKVVKFKTMTDERDAEGNLCLFHIYNIEYKSNIENKLNAICTNTKSHLPHHQLHCLIQTL